MQEGKEKNRQDIKYKTLRDQAVSPFRNEKTPRGSFIFDSEEASDEVRKGAVNPHCDAEFVKFLAKIKRTLYITLKIFKIYAILKYHLRTGA